MEELINPLIENMQEVIDDVKEAISAYTSKDEKALKKVADKLHIKIKEEDEQANQEQNSKDASQEPNAQSQDNQEQQKK